jgi:5-dehydro-2-deoxygluconokinase
LAAIAAAQAAGALVVLDIDHRAYSWASISEAAGLYQHAAHMADIVIGNDDEFGLMASRYDQGRNYARTLAQNGAKIAIYKRGALGSVTFTPDFSFETGIYAVTALKPMGAGDGFMGGLLAALGQGHTLETAVRRGSATASLIVSGIGCAPASPDTATLERFLTKVGETHAHRPS